MEMSAYRVLRALVENSNDYRKDNGTLHPERVLRDLPGNSDHLRRW
jgi:hypothetical protein